MTSTTEPAIDDVLGALANETARDVLRAIDRPKTAGELADELDASLTSVYRALADLSAASLVSERTVVRLDGHHTTRYAQNFEAVRVVVREDRSLALDVERRGLRSSNDPSAT